MYVRVYRTDTYGETKRTNIGETSRLFRLNAGHAEGPAAYVYLSEFISL